MDNELIVFTTQKGELKELISTALKTELSAFFNRENKEDDSLLTSKQVAKELNVSLPTLYSWLQAGIIASHRIGKNSVRYKAEDVRRALKEIQSLKYVRGLTIKSV